MLLGLTILLSWAPIYAQQDPQYTQYMYNQNILNPAYAGSRGGLSIGLLARSQWIGVPGAPETLTLSIESPIGKNIGIGLSVIHDEIGPAKEDNVYADFSYTIHLSEKSKLALGLKAGFTFLNVRPLKGQINTNDPTLSESVQLNTPNFGAGLFYYTEKAYIGVATFNLLEKENLSKEEETGTETTDKKHYFLTAGYVFQVSEGIKLKPSTMLKATQGTPLSVDISLNMLIHNTFEFGISHRLDDSVSAMIGYNISNALRIGYAYDYTLSNFGAFNSGSHEVMLLFDLSRNKLKNPRFF